MSVTVEKKCPRCATVVRGTPVAMHRILCGDARDPADVARLLAGEKVAVAVTSPPYAAQREYDPASGFEPVPAEEYVTWFEPVQAAVAQHLAPDGSWFVNLKEHCEDGQRVLYVKDLVLAHARRWGWRFIDEFCWTRKGVPGAWPNRFKNAWEPVFHFARADAIKFRPDAVSHESDQVFDYSPQNEKSGSGSGLLGERAAGFHAGRARPSNVIDVNSTSTGEHPAEFPVALPAFFIGAFSDRHDIVFDPFGGSGTTLIAAAQNGRRARFMEISPAYCDVIRRRFTTYARSAGQDPGPGALEDPT